MRIRTILWFISSSLFLSSCDFTPPETATEAVSTKVSAPQDKHRGVPAQFEREVDMEIPVVSTEPIMIRNFEMFVFKKSSPGLQRRRGKYVYRDSLFSGILEERFPEGQIRARTPYRNGVEQGTAYKWHPNGTFREERSYHAGHKHGRHRGWWKDGSPQFLYRFVDGDYDSECIDWHANGQVAETRRYERGHERGRQRSWSPDGKLLANYVVKDGRRYGRLGAKPCYTIRNDG